jgi:Sugar phosphate isomerases/epimerases
VEIWEPHIVKFLSEGKSAGDLKQLLQDYHLSVPVIATYFKFMEGKEKYRESLEHGRRVAEIASELFCPYIRVLMDLVSSHEATEFQWSTGIQALQELSEIGSAYNVGFILETHQSQLFDSTEMTLKVIREVDKNNIRVNLDIFNMDLARENPLESLQALFPYMVHMHLKNGIMENNQIKCSIYLDRGNMNYVPFFEKLRTMDYTGWLSVEWFGGDIWTAARHEYEYIKKMMMGKTVKK